MHRLKRVFMCSTLHVSPRLEVVACFPALGNGCMFSRAKLAMVACFRALGWQWLHVFPRFSRAWHQLPVFRACFSLYVFPCLAMCLHFSRVLHMYSFASFKRRCNCRSPKRSSIVSLLVAPAWHVFFDFDWLIAFIYSVSWWYRSDYSNALQ